MITVALTSCMVVGSLLYIAVHGAVLAPPKGCEQAHIQSSGFFCESEVTWNHRRRVYRAQQLKQVSRRWDKAPGDGASHRLFWQSNYEPNFSCALEERLGRTGDGGKWVCDPYRIEELRKNKKDCIVYSIGSNNEFSFEESVLARLPHCQVYTFDHTVTPKGVPKGVHFLNWGLGKENSGKLRTLETIAYKLGHTPDTSSIEILKIDIEGHEWQTVLPAMEKTGLAAVRQLLIELHPHGNHSTARRFFDAADRHGWVITHKEANVLQRGEIFEYALLRLGKEWALENENAANETTSE